MFGVGEALAVASVVSNLKASYDTIVFLKYLFSRDREIHFLVVRYEAARLDMQRLLEAADRKIAAQGDSILRNLAPEIKDVVASFLIEFNKCDLELKKCFGSQKLGLPAYDDRNWGHLKGHTLSPEDDRRLKSLVPKSDKLFKLIQKPTVVSNLERMEHSYDALRKNLCGILAIETADLYRGGIQESAMLEDEQELEVIAGAPDTFGHISANIAQLRLANIDPTKFLAAPRIEASNIKLEPSDGQTARSIADYNNQRVLIEWKYINPSMDDSSRARIATRVQELGKLLYQPKGKEFRVPQCLGVYSVSPFQLGYVFDLPQENRGHPGWYTLADRLQPVQNKLGNPVAVQTKKSNKRTPLLGDRFRLAFTLVKAFYLLHSASWLHKDFRSCNVLFFDGAGKQPDSETINIDEMYVGGFQYSRPDKPGEPSIETQAETDDIEVVIYRHPEVGSASSYSKKYDLYSLGVVLFEIALWEPLATRYRKVMHKKNRGDWIIEAADGLGPRVGALYRDVVKVCLESDSSDSTVEATDLNRVLLEDVLEPLGRCIA